MHPMKEFLWIPGQGYDHAALKRLQEYFCAPSNHKDQRFDFKGRREDLDKIDIDFLKNEIEETANEVACLGYREERTSRFNYLLAKLIPRSHEKSLGYFLEFLMTGFSQQYPNGITNSHYSQFQEDVINTLGRCIMDEMCWDHNEIIFGTILHSKNDMNDKTWEWWDASGDISSSLFFCLKYLPESLIYNWFKSALKIESVHWRAQLIVWLVGAHKILNSEIFHPTEFDLEFDGPLQTPSVEWELSYLIGSEYNANCREDPNGDFYCEGSVKSSRYLPKENIAILFSVLRKEMTDKIFFNWVDSIGQYNYLERDLGELPEKFYDLYVSK